MPRIRELVDIINSDLQTGPFNARKFQSGNWQGVAQIISREEQQDESTVKVKFPSIVDNDGEGTSVNLDDTYPIQFYHRIESLTYNEQEDDFGDPGNTTQEIADMVLICMGDRGKITTYEEDISAAIWASIPREFNKTILSALQLQSAYIEPLNVNLDSMSVFAQEYQGTDFMLNPNQFIISIKYRISTLYSKKCFTLCNN